MATVVAIIGAVVAAAAAGYGAYAASEAQAMQKRAAKKACKLQADQERQAGEARARQIEYEAQKMRQSMLSMQAAHGVQVGQGSLLEFDVVTLLGGALEELMDREFRQVKPELETLRLHVVAALAKYGLTYQRGGVILGGTLSTPSRSLEDLIRQRNLGELQKEFDRALANVEADPPAAITAACAILETLFKVIIADEGLVLPSDQSVLPLWRVVQSHLGLEPGKAVDPHVRQVLQGLASAIQGVAGLRSNLGSAHGRGPDAPVVEPRHARLAVHAAHTVVVFVL